MIWGKSHFHTMYDTMVLSVDYFQDFWTCGPTCLNQNLVITELVLMRVDCTLFDRVFIGYCTFNININEMKVKQYLNKFGWTKKNWLERDLNLQPPDWRAGALPTELSSPTVAVSLFCQYFFGGASQKSWNHILPFSQGSRPSYDTTWEQAIGDAP